MTSPTRSASVRRYRIRSSRILRRFFLLLLTLLLTCGLMASLVSGEWIPLLLSLLLVLLLMLKGSVLTQFDDGAVIEYRSQPPRLIFRFGEKTESYPLQEMHFKVSRWFMLVQLKRNNRRQTQTCMLLRDSFDDIDYYTDFRRLIIFEHGR